MGLAPILSGPECPCAKPGENAAAKALAFLYTLAGFRNIGAVFGVHKVFVFHNA
jgi:hypothetical protein